MNYDAIDTLGPKMLLRSYSPTAEIFYDLMSGSLIWSDEQIRGGLSTDELGCLRVLFRFRTSLIIKQPDPRFQSLWTKALAAYPEWIGFNPMRCQSSEELIKLYNLKKGVATKLSKRM